MHACVMYTAERPPRMKSPINSPSKKKIIRKQLQQQQPAAGAPWTTGAGSLHGRQLPRCSTAAPAPRRGWAFCPPASRSPAAAGRREWLAPAMGSGSRRSTRRLSSSRPFELLPAQDGFLTVEDDLEPGHEVLANDVDGEIALDDSQAVTNDTNLLVTPRWGKQGWSPGTRLLHWSSGSQ
ncbi:hypothetical protein EE612_036508 [Oryza sativa]|nr:hypothetical protein EE612_036508 [Oryza sativa]